MARFLTLVALFALVVAPVVPRDPVARVPARDKLEKETQERAFRISDITSPFVFDKKGFYFDPVALNVALLTCALPPSQNIKRDARCPTYETEELIEILKTYNPDAANVVLVEETKKAQLTKLSQDIITFGLSCLGELERRFQDGFPQPDGVLFVPVLTDLSWCLEFATTSPFFANRAALHKAMPRTGLAFEEHKQEEKVERDAGAELAGIEEQFTKEKVAQRAADLKKNVQAKDEDGKVLVPFESSAWQITPDELAKMKPKPVVAEKIEKKEEKEQEEDGGGSDNPTPVELDLLSVKEHARHKGGLLRRFHSLHNKHRNPFLSANGNVPLYRLLFKRIYFGFDTVSASINNHLMIQLKFLTAMRRWEAKTCITFHEVAFNTAGADDLKCYADLAGGPYLAWATTRETHINDAVCDYDCVTHEIGHTLGLAHVQQREDRNLYMRFHPGNLQQPGLVAQFERASDVPADGRRHYISDTDGHDVGLFDWDSIMLYGDRDGARYGLRAMTPVDYTLNDRFWNELLFPSWAGGLPPHRGQWGRFNGGVKMISDMDAFIINDKYGCFPWSATGARWQPGANPNLYRVCNPDDYLDSYIGSDGSRIPLCREKKAIGKLCRTDAECLSRNCADNWCAAAIPVA